MKPTVQDRARRLAALEMTLAAELARTRTMTLAVSVATRPAELEPAVGAWIADWSEDQASRGDNTALRDLIPVAIDQVSVQRVAATVWYHYQQEWAESESAAASVALAAGAEHQVVGPRDNGAPPSIRHALPVFRIPVRFSPRLKAVIEVGAEFRWVPPSVARALLEVAEGAELVKFRKETHLAILQGLPELAPHLVRLDDRKVISNKHTYRPSEELRRCLMVK